MLDARGTRIRVPGLVLEESIIALAFIGGITGVAFHPLFENSFDFFDGSSMPS